MSETQGEKRVHRPRKIFSPDDVYTRPSHYLLYYESTDSYQIALSSSINNIVGNTATLKIQGKKTMATIITTGTLEICENEQKKRTRESQEAFDDDQEEVSSDDENEKVDMFPPSQRENEILTFPLSNRRQITRMINNSQLVSNNESPRSISYNYDNREEANAQSSRFSRPASQSDLNHQSIITTKRKQNRSIRKNTKRQRTNNTEQSHAEDDEQINANANLSITQDINAKHMLYQIENHLEIIEKNMEKNLKRLEKKFEKHLGPNPGQYSRTLDPYRTEKEQYYPTEYMFEQTNLLNIYAKDIGDFARKTMKVLFSDAELKSHTLPPKRDHLQREPLDQERFNKLIEAIRIKFRLDSNMVQQCYNDLLKNKLSNFLYEERRREFRKQQRNEEWILKQKLIQSNHSKLQENINGEEDDEEIFQ